MWGENEDHGSVVTEVSARAGAQYLLLEVRNRRGRRLEESDDQFWVGHVEFEMGTLIRQLNMWVWSSGEWSRPQIQI